MIIRVFFHTLFIFHYLNNQFLIFDKKFQEFEEDYRRFLIYIFNLFIFEPICDIIKNFLIIFYIINFIFKFFFTLFFIKIPGILFFTYLIQPFNLTYILIESIYMFIILYISYIKYPLFIIKNFIIYLITEKTKLPKIIIIDNENYKIKKNIMYAPDLKVYYPMKFALSSILVRLTGIILSVSFIFIFFFTFINIFINGNAIFGDFEKIFPLKIVSFFSGYVFDDAIYYDPLIYNNKTFYSTLKCILIIMYTYISVCFKYLYYDFVIRFALYTHFYKIQIFFSFIYILFIKLFICILPIHIYYVIHHSFKIISISKYISYLFFYLKQIIKYLFNYLVLIFKKIWSIIVYIAKAEDKPL